MFSSKNYTVYLFSFFDDSEVISYSLTQKHWGVPLKVSRMHFHHYQQSLSTYLTMLESKVEHCTYLQKMKFSIKDFFSKCDHIHSFLHLLKKSLMESFTVCVVVPFLYTILKFQRLFTYKLTKQLLNNYLIFTYFLTKSFLKNFAEKNVKYSQVDNSSWNIYNPF